MKPCKKYTEKEINERIRLKKERLKEEKRIFEIKGFKVPQLKSKKQTGYIYTITGDTPNSSERKKRIKIGLKQQPSRIEWQRAMGGLWHIKSKNHISEAIPPQYSKYIVEHLETLE